jgi:hypothetical protein
MDSKRLVLLQGPRWRTWGLMLAGLLALPSMAQAKGPWLFPRYEPPTNGYWSYRPNWRDDVWDGDDCSSRLHQKTQAMSLAVEDKWRSKVGDYGFLNYGREMEYFPDIPPAKRAWYR